MGRSKLLRPSQRANVAAFLDGCSELHGLVANAVFEAEAGAAAAVCALRAVDHTFRTLLDAKIVDWMKTMRGMLEELRRAELQYSNVTRINRLLVSASEEQQQTAAGATETVTACRNRFAAFIGRMMSSETLGALRTAAQSSESSTMLTKLNPDVLTFACMALSRCQIHGPLGIKCRRIRRGPSMISDNFGVCGFDGCMQCIHANQKCIDGLCVQNNALTCRETDIQFEWHAFRQALRLRGVHYPFRMEDVHAVLHVHPSGEVIGASYIKWPGIPVFDHPAFARTPSVQKLLGLTAAEVECVKAEASRKVAQVDERKAAVAEIAVNQLKEDVNAEIAKRGRAFKSLKDLANISTGMERTIDATVRALNLKHAMDSLFVRDAIDTSIYFLSDVFEEERKAYGTESSAEAYEYVSGLHVGLYGTCCPTWKRVYGTLRMTRELSEKKLMHALRFFDSITSKSLTVRGKTCKIETELGVIQVELWTKEPWCSEMCTPLLTSLRHMVKKHHNEDKESENTKIQLPGLQIVRGRVAEADATLWATKCFRAMADCPWLRGGALDVLGIDSSKFVVESK